MFGVGRSLFLVRNLKKKNRNTLVDVHVWYMFKEILFSKTFSKIKRGCYRERFEGFNNDVNAGHFRHCTLRRLVKHTDINSFVFKECNKHAF